MARQNGGGGGHGASGGGGSSGEEDAKEVLDKIGQQVYEQVKKEADAKKYKDELKGQLSQVSTNSERITFRDTCRFEYDKHTTSANGNAKPCEKDGNVDRFSVKQQAEYDNKKIKCSNGSNGKNEGACASFRRLNLCNKNFPNMNSNDSSKAKHDLLAEVCYAAKFEGQSIKTHYPKYDAEYSSGSGFTLCTMLARSFADIGDIIRGKDLYLGYNRKEKAQKEKLENKLKEYFENIHDKLEQPAKEHYIKDKETGNYYKLREDWWTANRHTVWEALTCEVGSGTYFHATCSDGNSQSQAQNQCRCGDRDVTIVPTYFDYVPQFLRWFEEWAEDFCRKKKKYVNIVKTYCRGKFDNEPRYCSRNGFDCEQTVNARGKVRMGKGCTDCFFACNPYVEWIDNQRKQFLKQKEEFDKQVKKYTKEISDGVSGAGGSGRQRRGTTTTNYDGYEKKFYNKLKEGNVGNLDDFLGLLNNEKACKEVKDSEGGRINFKEVNTGGTAGSGSGSGGTSDTSGTNDEKKGTFYRSKYCQPCPLCGVEKKSNVSGGNTEWKRKDKIEECKSINLYKPNEDATPTPINFLYSGDRHEEINKKLEQFCTKTQNGTGSGTGGGGGGNSGSQELYDEWKCYQFKQLHKVGHGEDDHDYDNDVKEGGGLCILQNKKHESGNNSSNEPKEIQKTFNNFFYYWVAHMLKDSIYWRTKKLEKCLKNGTKTKCKNGCNKDCVCFQRWVGQKREEWKNIVQHFNTQNIRAQTRCNPIVTLEGVLELQFLNENTEEKSENSLDAQELKHLREMLKETGVVNGGGVAALGGRCTEGGVAEQNTLMDKLLDYEERIANTCVKNNPTDECPKPQDTPGARSLPPSEEKEDEDDEDEEEEDEDEDHGPDDADGNQQEALPDETEVVEETVADTTTPLDVCNTVKSALGGNLSEACNQKYGGNNSRLGWKCIPSGDNTTTGSESDAKSRLRRAASGVVTTTGKSDGSICVPPRRRRLYIGRLTQWAKNYNTDKSRDGEGGKGGKGGKGGSVETGTVTPPDSASPSDPRDGDTALRDAFIQSAAIETFFLWHRYKKENTKTQGSVVAPLPLQLLGTVGTSPTDDDKDPEKLLQSGNIPPDFLRQMFYTLGDYRDICVGNVPSGIDTNGKDTMQKIKENIEKLLPKNGPPPGQQPSDKRTALWSKYAEPIWNGMICALTYTDNTDTDQKGGTPKQNEGLKDALLEGGKPKNPQYQYTNVKLKEDNENGAKSTTTTQSSSSSDNTPTTLTQFVLRPPFFRYLEEWGENFCKERKKRLEKIKEDCYKDGGSGDKQYSGDGEDCTQMLPADPTTLPDLGSSCPKSCSFYKKWISAKKNEFEKQEKIYNRERESAKSNKNDNGFCGTLENYKEAKDFLQKLGPCSKKDNDNGEDNEKYITDFDKPQETFKPAIDCEPCSQFKVNCRNGNCKGDTKNECNGKTAITAKDIENKTDVNNIVMLVSDNSATEFKNGLEACQDKCIFEGIRKDEWKCRNVCGYVVCKPKNGNGKNEGTYIIQIRALVRRWVEYFLEDYNKIKQKISHCTKNRNGSTCIKDCEKKCNCVEKWIEKKRAEWETIRGRFNEQYKDQTAYNVKSVLETLQPQTYVNKAIKPCKDLNQFQDSKECAVAATTQNGKKRDVVVCLIEKLEKKANKCKIQNSGKLENCSENPPSTTPENEPLEEEEENENQVTQPKICGEMKEETKVEEEGDCEAASPVVPKKAEEKSEAPEVDKNIPKPAAPPSTPAAPAPTKPTPELLDNPHVLTALMSSTIMWSVGIGFAAFTYFYLK
ncbi:hypothetical protein PFMALIP_05793, partial [Plasmodium falciparum MaliPS096_E11]